MDVSTLEAAFNRLWEKRERELAKKQTEGFITVRETCNRLNVSRTTLHRWRTAGYLIPISRGAHVYYRVADVMEIMEGRRTFCDL